MQKFLIALLAALLLVSFGSNVYLYWTTGRGSVKDSVAEQKEKEQRADPVMHFVPEGWKIASSKEMILEEIYLPFLHVQLAGKKVRFAHIEGPGLKFTGSKSSYVNKRLTRGTVVVLAETGQLLRLVLDGDIPLGRLPGELGLAETEKSYQSSSMKYVDLPKGQPKHSFQEILNRLFPGEPSFGEEPHKAGRIAAVYVVEKYERFPADVAWNVAFHDFRGPMGGFGVQMRNMTQKLDSDGRLIQSSNQP